MKACYYSVARRFEDKKEFIVLMKLRKLKPFPQPYVNDTCIYRPVSGSHLNQANI